MLKGTRETLGKVAYVVAKASGLTSQTTLEWEEVSEGTREAWRKVGEAVFCAASEIRAPLPKK